MNTKDETDETNREREKQSRKSGYEGGRHALCSSIVSQCVCIL